MYILESILTLSNNNLTLKNKIVFAAVLIFLVALVAFLIQQNYFQSYRDSLTPADLLVSLSKFTYYESFYQEQTEIMPSGIL